MLLNVLFVWQRLYVLRKKLLKLLKVFNGEYKRSLGTNQSLVICDGFVYTHLIYFSYQHFTSIINGDDLLHQFNNNRKLTKHFLNCTEKIKYLLRTLMFFLSISRWFYQQQWLIDEKFRKQQDYLLHCYVSFLFSFLIIIESEDFTYCCR